MKPIPIRPRTLSVARNIVWFEPPEKTLSDPVRFMAYAVTYALPEDMRVIREFVSDDDLRDALDNAPAGIIDPRSWAYWNSKMARYPPPPLPVRRLDMSAGADVAGPERKRQHTGADGAQRSDLDEQRRHGQMAWLQMREQEPSKPGLEQARRLAREEWRAKYGPKAKDQD